MASPEQAEAFEWDDEAEEQGNTAHLAESRPDRPSIAWWEAEEVFENGGIFAPNKRGRSGDWLLVGKTHAGRALSLVIHYDEARRVIRVITGWDCTEGQRTRYL